MNEELTAQQQRFIAGKRIIWEDFKKLCDMYKVSIPVKTVKWAEKSLASITPRTHTYFHTPSKTINTISFNLFCAMTENIKKFGTDINVGSKI